jgi:hypothetical protein
VTSSPEPTKRRTARERAAARAAEAAEARVRARRRQRIYAVGGPILAIVLVVAIFLVVKATTGGSSHTAGGSSAGASSTSGTSAVAPAALITPVTTVPEATLNSVGVGTIAAYPKAVTGDGLLTADGLPRILYIGAEYCPYCAAERWAVVQALSRFGSFTNLGVTHSATKDVFPNTQTFSFHGATFSSPTISFTGVETTTNQPTNGGYAPLDTPTAADQALAQKYDSAGSIPFVDIGNRYIISGASFDPQVLQGKTAQEIADALADPSSPIAKAVIGSANVITAAICTTTNNQPAAVCNVAGVQAAAKALSAHNT